MAQVKKEPELIVQFNAQVKHVENDRYDHSPCVTFALGEQDVEAAMRMMKAEVQNEWFRVVVVKP
jgi:threonine dehydrogenase-like Zn-dependent dehydrogenase